jgi:eukaryotic-like serine/threonine-protein kinase
LEVIVKKALRKNRDERYQTIHDLLLDLKELKREADLALSLERSSPPDSRTGEVPTQTFKQSEISRGGSLPPVAPTAPIPAPHATSSAEYIASEIKRNKKVFGIAVAAVIIVALIGISLVALVLYRYSGREAASARKNSLSQNMKVTRLTTNGKTENAAISPDGKTVVYVLREGGQRSLWIRQVATNSNVQIVAPSGARIGRETFSPDGNYVYYQAFDRDNSQGALFQVPALGGVPRKILSNIAGAITFSPDGSRIAFIRNDNAATGEDQLILANADGSNESKLAVRKGDTFFPSSGMSWSPDGKVIASPAGAYAGGFHLTVVAVDVASGQQKEITTRKFSDIGRVSWLSDGSGVLVNAAEQGTSMNQIWLIAYPGSDTRAITHDLNDYGGTSLTADSKSLVTVQFNGSSNIWIAPSNDLNHGKQITTGQLEGDRGLAWTPDNKIVYTSLASGNIDLWILNSDGTNQKQLTTDPQQDDSPRVSPDGRYIFFNSLRGGLPSIWRMDIDGSNLKQITDKEDYLLDISSDGGIIYFISWRTTRLTLWRTSRDGGEPVQISNMFIVNGSLSSDGKNLACVYQDEKPNSPNRLIILPVTGGEPTRSIDLPPSAKGRPTWSPDGKSIVIYDERTGTNNLWSQPLDGGPMKQLTDFKPDSLFARDLSRDGKFMAMSRGTVTGDVILISDFR